jgi:hypothetical protein
VCLYSCLSCPESTAHAPYIVICGLSGSTMFRALSHKRHDFREKKLPNIKSVFWFSLQLLSEIFLSVVINQRGIFINVHRSSCNVPVNLVRFHKKSYYWEPKCVMQTGRNDDDNTRSHNYANAPNARTNQNTASESIKWYSLDWCCASGWETPPSNITITSRRFTSIRQRHTGLYGGATGHSNVRQ